MNVITLGNGILALNDDGVSVSLPSITSGTWRIVRCDDWSHDERVVTALRLLEQRPGVTLVDPTGLLGGSRYGTDTGREIFKTAAVKPLGSRRKGGASK